MIALEITDIKDFMNKLLASDIFDHFLLQEATIVKDASFMIDGRINENYYTAEDRKINGLSGFSFLPYALLRANCLSVFKGKRKPLSFKFIFLLSPQNLEKTLASCQSTYTPADVSGVSFNLLYQDNRLILTTGISYRIFSVDKTLDREWDRLVKLFLRQKEISFEEL